MKKGIWLGLLVMTGGLGWCEEAANPEEKTPVSAASDTATVTEKKDAPAETKTQTPDLTERATNLNAPEKTAVAAPVAEKPKQEPVTDIAVPAKTEPAPAIAKSDPAPIAQKPADEKPAGRVALLEKIAVFHEKEIESVKEMIHRWNVTLKPHLDRQQSLQGDLAAKRAKMASLEKEGTKTARKEAKSIKKEISGTEKLIQSVQKDIAAQYKSMSNETKLKAGITEKSFQDTVRSVIDGIQSPTK